MKKPSLGLKAFRLINRSYAMKALVIIAAICAMTLQPALGLSIDTVPNGYTEIQIEGFQVLVCNH
jgi:hypothetical protein